MNFESKEFVGKPTVPILTTRAALKAKLMMIIDHATALAMTGFSNLLSKYHMAQIEYSSEEPATGLYICVHKPKP